ncbi:TPA: RNA-binding protein [Candidatus Woesearchaeota archaeon]|nr:hypothetical protein [uncultured archaeon]AQS32089.1 hypothetical protein [uncultured archaeon]MBS3115283.1 RNA-binding protein [Candidatus Woesearchaeota archaeon]HIH39919.1 RNA-binding protein [Candidatus Woesearchaeota archaeon]
MKDELTCISCRKKITNTDGAVSFNCPKCKEKIIRCGHCRSIAAKYICKCGFSGPV